MTHFDAVTRMAAAYGLKVFGPYHTPHRPQLRWQTWGGAAEGLLRSLRPYLLVKAEQADIALRFMAAKRAGDSKEQLLEYRDQLIGLNGKHNKLLRER
jgi:hypothetical protein